MNPHAATPTLSVIDPRTLAVHSVGYCRHPDSPMIDPRITRQRFDAAGRLVESWDPRLWGTAPKPNLTTLYGLSGQPLLTDSVDGGWQLGLPDQAGSPCSFWDARGSQRHTGFDAQQRPIAVVEQVAGEAPRVVERLTYGDCAPAFAERNQCGQLIRHDHPAGTQIFPAYGLAGAVLVEEQRFLADLEIPDWPLDIDERETWLEDRSFITRHAFNPGGELQRQTDAMGNVRTFGYNVAGKVSETWLHMAGEGTRPQRLVSAIRYNALNQVESETAGNGVLTRVEYAADDGRLIRLTAAVGNQNPLQDLNYRYDPLGNIVELEDKSQSVTYFNNQRIDPINRYRYDSLYQLVEARGWEVSQPSHGPTLPTLLPTPLDPNQRRNYTQRFEYDRGGNLISRQHSGAPGFSMFTSARSNRSLGQRDDGSLPGEPDIDSGFDAGGNQRELQRGQAMLWDSRNQLHQVTLVKRETGPDDYEGYRYDRPGHRLRKVGFAHSSGRTLRSEVRYLPGLEIHRQAEGEEHHVISVEAGRSNVRALHWPADTHDDQLRFSLSDHLGSSTLELDDEAGVLTQEHYYPFGGTACWAGKSALVAQYKTIRYSGKELDVTGLYYYGYRYYAPWLQRWLSSDPAGDVAGSNQYQMVKNNPVVFYDSEGLINEPIVNRWEREYQDLVGKRLVMKLQARLNITGEDGARYEFVSSALKHDLGSIESGRITSKISNYVGEITQSVSDEFYNLYTKDEWSFIRNKRPSKAKEYYAADVVKYQYSAVSKHNGFFGHLPSVIRRTAVVNANTIKLTENLKSGSKEMMDVFLDKTENGKSTKRIADVFGMTPWKVERIDEPAIVIQGRAYQSPPDFLVHVKPAAGLRRPSVWEELESFRTSKSEARSLNSSGVRRRSSL
ncbi:RHS repeat-associated protein [Pseudomonas sp. S30_BP2TU TE3576]|uniref:RHS repeat domain-containing protein n=1 Tax=Pseudomonas sp. S30_BP2TU TE3576 TaxID=3349329 RepID=UPI003D2371D1